MANNESFQTSKKRKRYNNLIFLMPGLGSAALGSVAVWVIPSVCGLVRWGPVPWCSGLNSQWPS